MFQNAVIRRQFVFALAAVLGRCTCARAKPPRLPLQRRPQPELRVFDPSLIDKTIDPCENFYRYSCNGWFKRNPLPPDQATLRTLYRAVRTEPAASEADSGRRGHALSHAHRQRTEDRRRVRELHGYGGGQQAGHCAAAAGTGPHCCAQDRRRICPRCLAHLHDIGVNAFFGMGSNQDFADASQVISFY